MKLTKFITDLTPDVTKFIEFICSLITKPPLQWCKIESERILPSDFFAALAVLGFFVGALGDGVGHGVRLRDPFFFFCLRQSECVPVVARKRIERH